MLVVFAAALFCCGTGDRAAACVESHAYADPRDSDDGAAIQRAVATGRCVHITTVGRELTVNNDIVIKTPGQLIYGDGRLETRIRAGDRQGFKRGVFVAASGEPGPIFRDFGVFFNQPDTSLPGELIQYKPAFALNATPRFRMEHMGCYLAIVCVEAKENSGGAILDDVQLTAFSIGIDIDDALDSVRLENIQWYPFYLTPKLFGLFTKYPVGHAIGIKLGRVDDFHIVDGLFLGGLGLMIGPSSEDGIVGFGSVRGCDFDGGDGMAISAVGSVNVVGNEFTIGNANATSLSMTNGLASIVGNKFLLGIRAHPLDISGGVATIVGNTFAAGGTDGTLLTERGDGTQIVLSSNAVVLNADRPHAYPLVDVVEGDFVGIGNVVTPMQPGGTGVLIRLRDGAGRSHIDGNIAAGWRVEGQRPR